MSEVNETVILIYWNCTFGLLDSESTYIVPIFTLKVKQLLYYLAAGASRLSIWKLI